MKYQRASQVALVIKNLPANAGDVKRCRFNPWVRKIRWRREWQPTPVFLPGESPGQRSLVRWAHTRVGHSLTTTLYTYSAPSNPTRGVHPTEMNAYSHKKAYKNVYNRFIPNSPKEVKWSEVAQSCPTLCDPVDCSSPGSSVHGVLQVGILEWVAISFSKLKANQSSITSLNQSINGDISIQWNIHYPAKGMTEPLLPVTSGTELTKLGKEARCEK